MTEREENSNNILNEIKKFFKRIMPTDNLLFNIVIIVCIAYIISSLIQMFKINLNLNI